MSFVKVDAPPRPVVVISGPGGSGKTTIVQQLLADDDTLWFPRSWSTRKPRFEGEDEYRFVDEQRFETMIMAGGFLEVAHVDDYRVGAPVVHGRHTDKLLLLILTVDGWLQIRNQFPISLAIWLDSNEYQREKRMRLRGDSQQRIAERLELARFETIKSQQLGYDATVVNSDGRLDAAVSEVQAYIACFKHTL